MTTHHVALADGRRLGYDVYGAVGGITVLYFHGLPGSRLEGQLVHAITREQNIRVLAIDRPGYGMSSPGGASRLSTWADDIRQFLQQLSLTDVGILGVSGGAPYALACAANRLPHADLKVMPGEGHFSLPIRYADRILAALVSGLKN